MLAGTIGVLRNSMDEPLESHFKGARNFPAIAVDRTQSSFDDRPIQSGMAAGSVDTVRQRVETAVNREGEPISLHVEEEEGQERVWTDWVADFTESGVVIAESVKGDPAMPFPFDLLWNVTGSRVDQPWFDVGAIHRAWSGEDVLGDVWMVGKEEGDGTKMEYHDAARDDDEPTFGLGFERPWNGTVMRGVVYASGYIAVYNTTHRPRFMRFVVDELLPHTVDDADDVEQATL